MKYLWRRIVALTMGLGLTGVVIAGPPQAPVRWGIPAGSGPAQPVQGFQPVSYQQPAPQRPAPAVVLDRPVPIADVMPVPEPLPNGLPLTDAALRPAAFTPSADLNMGRPPLMRQDAGQLSPGMFNWKQTSAQAENPKPPETAPLPRPEPLPMPKAEPLGNPGTTPTPPRVPLPIPSGPVYSSPPAVGAPGMGASIGSSPFPGAPIVGTPMVGAPLSAGPTPVPMPPFVGQPCGPEGCPAPVSCGMAPVSCGTSVAPCWVDGADPCYTPWSTFFVSAEYLMWWTSGSYVPPLVTTGTPDANGIAGVLGRSDTVILHGDETLFGGMRSGARFSSGIWLDENRCFGLDGSFFFLGQESQNFFVSSSGNPPLFRPYFNANPNNPILVRTPGGGTAQLVPPTAPLTQGVQITASNPSGTSGYIDINHKTDFWGADANFRTNIFCCPNTYIDMVVGWRTMTLEDQTRITEFVSGSNANGPENFLLTDEFNTKNVFNGAQIGFVGEHQLFSRWTLGWTVKMGMGVTRQQAAIYGSTVISGAGANPAGNFEGGLLAQSSNIGSYSRSVFSVVPEVQLNLGYQINPHLRAFVGYNFMYWSNVARAGEQINLNLNPGYLAPFRPLNGPAEPSFNWNSTGFWAQGINFGLDFRW